MCYLMIISQFRSWKKKQKKHNTISELVGKGQESWIQQVVDDRSGFGKGWRISAKWKEIQRARD